MTCSFGQTARAAAAARALVGGIGVGVDEHDRQRLRALRRERFARALGDLLGVDRDAQRTVGQRALADFDREIALDDGNEIAAQAPGARPVAAAHFQHVAKAWRRDEADPRALAFEQRVGADRRAMHDGAEVGDAAERFEPGEEALRLVAALRRRLGRDEAAGRAVKQHEVGEGAADIDADQSRARSSARLRS